jgi:hypothetical protein
MPHVGRVPLCGRTLVERHRCFDRGPKADDPSACSNSAFLAGRTLGDLLGQTTEGDDTHAIDPQTLEQFFSQDSVYKQTARASRQQWHEESSWFLEIQADRSNAPSTLMHGAV